MSVDTTAKFPPSRHRVRRLAGVLALCVVLVVSLQERRGVVRADVNPLLPNGRALTPAGRLVSAGDFPAAALLSPQGTLYVADAGAEINYLDSVDPKSLSVTATRPNGTTPSGGPQSGGPQSGALALSVDRRTLYAAGGTAGMIDAFSATSAPTQINAFSVGKYVGGVAASVDGNHLFAALPFDSANAWNKGHQLVRLDMRDGTSSTIEVGQVPFALATRVLPRTRTEVVAVANRDDGTVQVVNARTLTSIATIAVGRHPAALAFTRDGRDLLVVASLDDLLVDISTRTWTVTATVSLSSPGGLGASPSALSVSPSGGSVYVALSADNAVAVVRRAPGGAMTVLGRIPTAVYPTGVVLDARRNQLLVTAGKGIEQGSGVPPGTPLPAAPSLAPGKYSWGANGGVIEQISLPPSRSALDSFSAQVAANNGWAMPCCTASFQPAIQHVIYIVRENKTYDQELGDEPGGSPGYLMYGKSLTPNTHALAEKFALLQSFYSNEEVSDTGHQVVLGSVVNDWVQRFTQQSYGQDGAPHQGGNNASDVAWSPANYLLDAALTRGISFRDYGELYRQSQSVRGGIAVTSALDAHIVHAFPGFGFRMDVTDTTRVNYWIDQFNQDVANNTFPALEVIYLPEDHTCQCASPMPQQQVADSDLATGRVVDALSHSPYWTSSVVFLTEDDPQSGLDHIDMHRTVGLVISPWVAPGTVASQHLDQVGMLRTIEELLGLPPLTEFDRSARPMDALFASGPVPPNAAPYAALSPVVPPISSRIRGQYARLVRRLLGRHPDYAHVPPRTQFELQWFATHGTLYRASR